MKRVLRTTTAAGAVLVIGLIINPAQAEADNGRVGVRETICADTLQFRTAPGGARAGTLHRNETFLVERSSNGWVYGFAYGDINHRGWVEDGWFC